MYKNQYQYNNIQQNKNKLLMNPFVKEENKQDSKNDDSNFTAMAISTLEAMKKANKEG